MERQRRQQQPSNLAYISRFLSDFARQFQQTSQQFLDELAEERKRRGDLNNFATRLEAMVKDMVSTSRTMEQTNAELTATIKDVSSAFVCSMVKDMVSTSRTMEQTNAELTATIKDV